MKDFSPLSLTTAVVGFIADVGVITRQDGTIIRFSNADEPIIVTADATYPVVPGLKVSAVKHTANGEMPSCQFVGVYGVGYTFDANDLDTGLYDGAAVQLYKVDRSDLSRKGLLFTGAMSNMRLDPINNLVSFDVKGPASAARRVLTQKRSPMCRTDLFSTLCGLNKASYAVSAAVVSVVDAFDFTVSGLAQADGYFNQGVVETANGVAFEIATWTNSTQTLMSYLPVNRLLSVGLGLTLYPGCDKTLGANGCGRFSNALNFVGEPHFLGTAAAAQQV